jgi:hypothetical protein
VARRARGALAAGRLLLARLPHDHPLGRLCG